MENMKRLRNKKDQIWVNVASSVHVLEDFVNLDNHLFIRFTGIYPFIKKLLPGKYHPLFEAYRRAGEKTILRRHDCRKALPFPEESVDHILCSHFLEHVYPVEMAVIVADFVRVLKKGGTLHVIVPDLALLVRQYLENSEKGDAGAADQFVIDTLLSREQRGSSKYRFLELVGGFGLQHYWMYDSVSLVSRLTKIGFEVLPVNDSPSWDFRLHDGSLHLLVRKPQGDSPR